MALTPSFPNPNPILLALRAVGPISAKFGDLPILHGVFGGDSRSPSALEIQGASAINLSLQPKVMLPIDAYTVLPVG